MLAWPAAVSLRTSSFRILGPRCNQIVEFFSKNSGLLIFNQEGNERVLRFYQVFDISFVDYSFHSVSVIEAVNAQRREQIFLYL